MRQASAGRVGGSDRCSVTLARSAAYVRERSPSPQEGSPMTRRLTATIGLGALALTGGALAMLPAQAAPPDPVQRSVDVSIGQQGQVNIAGTGLVPVVIHGVDGIDATSVDPRSITVGDGAQPARTSTGTVIANLVD